MEVADMDHILHGAIAQFVSRAEVAAAFAKAVRAGLVKDDVARNAQRRFAEDWPDLARVSVTEAVAERAERLAWEHGLRGYDAVQLASAVVLFLMGYVSLWQPEVAQKAREAVEGATPEQTSFPTPNKYQRNRLADGEAKEFARIRAAAGDQTLIAGTINPASPKRVIPSASIAAWLDGAG